MFFDNEIVYKKTRPRFYESLFKKKIDTVLFNDLDSGFHSKSNTTQFFAFKDTAARFSCNLSKSRKSKSNTQ
jgi:hypothetical protein